MSNSKEWQRRLRENMAGWKENLEMFKAELKNIQGFGLSDIGCALKETFDLLNMPRLQSGIDNYGLGRNPSYVQPALVLLLTDGCSFLNMNGIMNEIIMPKLYLLPGAELTKELYRWDQRLFSMQLKIPGYAQSVTEKHLAVLPEDMPLSNLCDQTGGKLYNIGSQKQLMQSLESIAQKFLIPGVIINFLKYGPDPEDAPPNEGPQEKTDENLYVGNDCNDQIKGLCNGKIPFHVNGILDEKHLLDHHQLHGLNGMVNGQGILPTPPSTNMRALLNANQMGRPLNGDDSIDRPIMKTEGLPSSTSDNRIPETPIRGIDESYMENALSPASLPISTAWHHQRRMIYIRNNTKGSVGHWPIPESFWPKPTSTRLPPRDCQPVVRFTCKPVDAMVIDNMPFDKYELEPSPLTQFILQRRQPNSAWQTFIGDSSPDSEIGYPFGYLKASTNLQCVNLFVLPYNYPVVMPLLDELFKVHKCKPTAAWKQSFQEYLQTMPSYYYVPLSDALRRMKAPNNLLPDHHDVSLSYSIASHLKKLKHQAKTEHDRLMGLQSQKDAETNQPEQLRVPQLNDGKLRDFKELLIQKTNWKKKSKLASSSQEDTSKPFERRSISCNVPKKLTSQTLRNPFDIKHTDIIQHVTRMRLQFFRISSATNNSTTEKQNLGEEEQNVSIAEMGNYQERIQQFKPLREVDPSQVRIHTFGNPFKLKQDQMIAIDEADVIEMPAIGGPNPRKRTNEINVAALQKGKRKRNETPPPSRRPVGIPNTPPPYLRNTKFDDFEKRTDLNNLIPDHEGVLKDLTGSLERINTMDNAGKDGDKKHSNHIVSKQLRKLQQIHRNKKENLDVLSEKIEELSEQFDSQSPILSILRTSFEDDRDNYEVSQLTDGNDIDNDMDEEGRSSSTTTPTSNVFTPVPVLSPLLMEDVFRNMPEEQLRNIYKELHARKTVKTRLAIWQAIRDKKDFSLIDDMVKRLSVEIETKYMFVMNLIYEAEKFQCIPLEDKLITILRDIQLLKNG